MKKHTKFLAALLSVLLLVSLLPMTVLASELEPEETAQAEQAPQTQRPILKSMMPLKVVSVNLDLTSLLPSELQTYSTESFINAINATDMGQQHSIDLGTQEAVWAKFYYRDKDGNYVSENDNYTRLGDVIDLADYFGQTNSVTVELIVGTVDQLDLNNLRYRVSIEMSSIEDIFTVSLANTARETVEAWSTDCYLTRAYNSSTYKSEMYTRADIKKWTNNAENYLSLGLTSGFSDYDATVYEGSYSSEEEIPATAKDITGDIWNTNPTVKGYQANYSSSPEVTIVLKRGGATVDVLPLMLYVYGQNEIDLQYSYDIYADDEGNRQYVSERISSSTKNGVREITFTLPNGYAANGTYYFTLWARNNKEKSSSNYGIAYVKKAVVGNYATEAGIPGTAVDIKEQLYSSGYSDGGYAANYSQGVTFTLVGTNGDMDWITVKTVAGSGGESSVPSAPTPLSEDTYFRINGAGYNNEGYSSYNTYAMPYEADSYYYNGYQTLFLLKRGEWDSGKGAYNYLPVTDANIIPNFYTGSNVQMFASQNGGSAVRQTSRESAISFVSGKPVQYSAAAENGTNLKNYWVTFLTQQSGPKLFVNAASDDSMKVEVAGQQEKMFQREVFLTEDYDNHHDVFFANIGDENITGLYVKLEGAENVALDDYWKVASTTTLSAFTTTESRDPAGNYVYYGDLANFAKVRLVPVKDEKGNISAGVIAGTLVIGYTGSGAEPVEEVRINLTGVAGVPKITTETVVDGVKYVPYSSLIQTNNMYASNTVKFTLASGQLPAGVSLKPNGEIYGVPTVTGDFTFTVKASYGENDLLSDSKEFTLTILDNTDANVEAANTGAQGYPLLDAVDRNLSVNSIPAEGVLFRSEGTYSEFMAFYLDGKKLIEGTDYTSEEGSTKITIQAQTFKNAGNGTHTIAAEFRTDHDEDGTMKRTAQNVTVSGVSNGGRGGSSSSGASTVENTTSAKSVMDKLAAQIAAGNMSNVVEVRSGAISAALKAGHGIVTNVSITEIGAGQVPSADMNVINKKLGSAVTANKYMNVVVTVKDATTGEVLGTVSQTPSAIQFSVALSQSALNAYNEGKHIYALRVHNGVAEYLNVTVKDGKAYFNSNKFSTYAIVISDQKQVTAAQTSDAGILLYGAMAFASMMGTGLVIKKKREEQ